MPENLRLITVVFTLLTPLSSGCTDKQSEAQKGAAEINNEPGKIS